MPIPTLKPRIRSVSLTRIAAAPAGTERHRGYGWMKRRAAWLSEHPTCAHCEAEGRVGLGQNVDHVVPLWAGGADHESNFQSLCVMHHQVKTAREAAERAMG